MEKTGKTAIMFSCESCGYSAFKQSDFNKHILTGKHLRNVAEQGNTREVANTDQHGVTGESSDVHSENATHTDTENIAEIKKPGKTPKCYSCDLCDFITGNLACFKRHTSTSKHIENERKAKNPEREEKRGYDCDICSKNYQTQSGLWRHKKTCVAVSEPASTNITTEMFLQVMKQNKDLQDFIMNTLSQPIHNSINNR